MNIGTRNEKSSDSHSQPMTALLRLPAIGLSPPVKLSHIFALIFIFRTRLGKKDHF